MRGSRIRGTGAAFAGLALGLLFYGPTLGAYLTGDDFIWLYEASRLDSVQDLWRPGHFPFVRPTNTLFHWLGWQAFGTWPAGYHAAMLVLHLGTVVLLYLWIRSLTGSFAAGLAAGLVFLAYAQHLESVVWLSAVGETLAAPAMLGSLLCYRAWRVRGGRGLWAGALACLAAALLSKESAYALPLLLILVDLLLLPWEGWARTAARQWPFWALAALLGVWAASHLTGDRPHGYLLDVAWLRPAFYAAMARYTLGTLGSYEALRLVSGPGLAAAGAAYGLLLVLAWRRAPVAAYHLAWIPLASLAYAWFQPGAPLYDRFTYLGSLGTAGLAGWVLAASAGRPVARVLFPGLVALYACWQGLGLWAKAEHFAQARSGPQPEALAFASGRPPGRVYVNTPPGEEPYPRYAVALLGGLEAGQVRDWSELRRLGWLEPDGTAFFFQKGVGLWDLTPHLRRMVREDGPSGTLLEPLIVWSFLEDSRPSWEFQGLERQGATFTTPGGRARMLSPRLDLTPLRLEAVEVSFRVLRLDAGGPAFMGLGWTSELRPRPSGTRLSSLELPPAGQSGTLMLRPGSAVESWAQGRIQRLVLIPSTRPASLVVHHVKVWGYGAGTPAP